MSDSGLEHILDETARLISTSIAEVVPPEAQIHLLRAQRELLMAVSLTIEHNAQRLATTPAKKTRKGTRAKAAAKRKANTPKKISIT